MASAGSEGMLYGVVGAALGAVAKEAVSFLASAIRRRGDLAKVLVEPDVTEEAAQQFVAKTPGPAGGIAKAEQKFVRQVVTSVRKSLARGGMSRYRPLGDVTLVGMKSPETGQNFLVGLRPSVPARALLIFIGTRRRAKDDKLAETTLKVNDFNRSVAIGRVYVDDDGELMVDYGLSLAAGRLPEQIGIYVHLLAGVADGVVRDTSQLTDPMT